MVQLHFLVTISNVINLLTVRLVRHFVEAKFDKKCKYTAGKRKTQIFDTCLLVSCGSVNHSSALPQSNEETESECTDRKRWRKLVSISQ